MKTVYRIENKNGVGPYRCNYDWEVNLQNNVITQSKLCSVHNDCPMHPSLYQDELYSLLPTYKQREEIYKSHVCGFISLKQLCRWFNKYWRNILTLAEFSIVKYEIPETDIIKLKHQILFKKPETQMPA